MRGPLNLRSPVGWLTALGLLAVASLGVTLAYTHHASGGTDAENVVSVPAESLSCEAGGLETADAVNRVSELVRQWAAANPPRDGSIVVLNTRGYNYRPTPAPAPGNAPVDANAGR